MNRLSIEDRSRVIGCLVEGNSQRATVRMAENERIRPTQDPKDSGKSRQRSHRNAAGHPGEPSQSFNHPLKRHFPAPSDCAITRLRAQIEIAQRKSKYGFGTPLWRDVETVCAHAEKLAEALRNLFRLVEIGVLVRDISHDADPKWYLKAIELTQVLKAAQTVLSDWQKEAK